jgi:hypothetical protein
MMVVRRFLAGLMMMLMLAVALQGCTKVRNEHLAGVDSTLTYAVVAKDIDKHEGKRVAWLGISLGFHSVEKDGKTVGFDYYTYLPADNNGAVDFDKPFMFSHVEGADSRTPAAKAAQDQHQRLVIGTIAGSAEFKYQEGSVSKTIAAPLLVDVIVDLPPEK